MIVLPKEDPVIRGLNSYYADAGRLIEHYQGEIGAGAVHFTALSTEGVVFFDKDEVLGGACRRKEEEIAGAEAAERLMAATNEVNFNLDVYAIDPGKIHFWANIPWAEIVYRDLAAEFTDLEGLINKMASEGLTGYIEVAIRGGGEGGLLFFLNGGIIGGSYSWSEGGVNGAEQAKETLLRKIKEQGGTFNVARIPAAGEGAPGRETGGRSRPEPGGRSAGEVIRPLQELLVISERVLAGGGFTSRDFRTSLKRKLVEKADAYPFLDPFAGEFDYAEGTLTFTGSARAEELLQGVTESLSELARDLGAGARLSEETAAWKRKYAGLLSRLGTSSL